jgi:hypothetical protein
MRAWLRAAAVRFLRWACVTETIGQEECPMMLRWEFLRLGKKPWLKAMIHYFPPNVTDRDPHDHPRSFLTLILRGGYLNTEFVKLDPPLDLAYGIRQNYMSEFEWMSAGMVRFRRAEHLHLTETGDAGAWTLVVMGPEKRDWGFVAAGRWWAWRPYVERFGGVVRCDTGDLDQEQEGEYAPYEVTSRDYKQGRPPL